VFSLRPLARLPRREEDAKHRLAMPLTDERLFRILENQGYRELVSAHLFSGGVSIAPTIDEKHMLAEHAQEELAHFEAVATLYEQLTGHGLYDRIAERAARVPSPASWLEAAVAGYLVDRAASVQLAEYRRLDDVRLGGVARHIMEHEHEHQRAAESALLDLFRGTPEHRELASAHVTRWYPLALGILDDEDRGRVGAVFAESIRATLAACGISTPASDGA